MFNALFGPDSKRKKLLAKAPEGPLKDFLSEPFPNPALPISQTPILAVDFETTGPASDPEQILSVGFIEIKNHEILLSSAYHQIIKTSGDLDEKNVIIHQITDDAKDQGTLLESAMIELLEALKGKVLLAHFSHTEKKFLQDACKQLYGMEPDFPVIDTLFLARNRLSKKGLPFDRSDLRLSNLRNAHGLPHHSAHNALQDALATAELFFAEIALLGDEDKLTLKSVLL